MGEAPSNKDYHAGTFVRRYYLEVHPSTRQPILALPQEEVDKICAGEVVERPLSVVKELVENSLDAGARKVQIDLEDGGKALIRVSDDGHGIPEAELALALRPHHTSKIRRLDDLFALTTLGFRGEALGAVSAVARVSISSRFGIAQAMRVEAEGGSMGAAQPCNLQRGTEVEVRDLFFNTPARRKFLRSAQSETAQVSGLLTAYALAYPEVQWTLKSGGRVLLLSDGDGDLAGVAKDLLGPDLADSLATVNFEYPPYGAKGLVSTPPKHWHNRTRQWYFVNRRPVTNKLLYKAVDDSVREFMSPGRFPAGVFFLDIPPEELDANVHPAKAEINFANPQQVYSLLVTALRRALGAAAAERKRSLTRGMALVVKPMAEPLPAQAQAGLSQASLSLGDQPAMAEAGAAVPQAEEVARDLDSPVLDPDASSGQRAVPVYEMGRPFIAPAPMDRPPLKPADREIEFPVPPHGQYSAEGNQRGVEFSAEEGIPVWGRSAPIVREETIETIQQVADTYLVLPTPGEVYLIDQHSAHERILFEQIWERIQARLSGESIPRQRLLFPVLVGLPPSEAIMLTESLSAFETLGFVVEPGAGSTLIIHEMPALLSRYLTPELLQSVASDLADPTAQHHAHLGWAMLDDREGPVTDSTRYIHRTPNQRERLLVAQGQLSSALANRIKLLAATLACKAAVKAGQVLSYQQRSSLLREILVRWSSLSCPHGRPTVIRLGQGELERMFLRS